MLRAPGARSRATAASRASGRTRAGGPRSTRPAAAARRRGSAGASSTRGETSSAQLLQRPCHGARATNEIRTSPRRVDATTMSPTGVSTSRVGDVDQAIGLGRALDQAARRRGLVGRDARSAARPRLQSRFDVIASPLPTWLSQALESFEDVSPAPPPPSTRGPVRSPRRRGRSRTGSTTAARCLAGSARTAVPQPVIALRAVRVPPARAHRSTGTAAAPRPVASIALRLRDREQPCAQVGVSRSRG